MRRTRRATLAVLGGAVTLAGCTSTEQERGSQDSDGDGVPDEPDYAPDDPEVQSKNDLGGDGSVDEGETGSGSGGGDSSGDSTGGNNNAEGGNSGGSSDDITYPSHSGTHTITARDNYWAWEVSISERFVLEYRVTNLQDENYDFDVLLYDASRFQEYRAIANEQQEGIRPQYIEGSSPGVESGAGDAVELPGGTYYLVIDNTDLSDAGDWGTEETRRVSVEASTRSA